MNDEQVLSLVKEALFEVAPNRKAEFDKIRIDQTIEDLSLDSIATMEMVGFLEDKTDKTFPDEELAKVNTVRDLVSLVQNGRL
ncbi:MAG: acyl carrier protein [Deltaproteobacteria bacterium]|nr:MAG: acyl carrier protein [Deltaproteobacteria bacterium]